MVRYRLGRTGSPGGGRASPLVASLAAAVVALTVPVAAALDGPNVMRVEEDWELRLNEPGEMENAPQFHSLMSPSGNTDSFYFQICWNYHEDPDFVPGGLQLVAYNDDDLVGSKAVRSDQLSRSAETIVWTQSLSTNGLVLTFNVSNGRSVTWGSFGGPLASLALAHPVSNLNNYRPSVSAASSWVSYGANRVNLVQIREVRYYDAVGNLIDRDQTPRVVYRYLE